jgi:enhancing lycopene biosynthesis protein 2
MARKDDRPDVPQGIADHDMVLWDHLGGQQTLTDYASNGNKFVIDSGSAGLEKVKQDSPAPYNFNLIASVISADRLSSTLGVGVGPDASGRWNYSWLSVLPGLGQLIRIEEMLPGTEVTNYNRRA